MLTTYTYSPLPGLHGARHAARLSASLDARQREERNDVRALEVALLMRARQDAGLSVATAASDTQCSPALFTTRLLLAHGARYGLESMHAVARHLCDKDGASFARAVRAEYAERIETSLRRFLRGEVTLAAHMAVECAIPSYDAPYAEHGGEYLTVTKLAGTDDGASRGMAFVQAIAEQAYRSATALQVAYWLRLRIGKRLSLSEHESLARLQSAAQQDAVASRLYDVLRMIARILAPASDGGAGIEDNAPGDAATHALLAQRAAQDARAIERSEWHQLSSAPVMSRRERTIKLAEMRRARKRARKL